MLTTSQSRIAFVTSAILQVTEHDTVSEDSRSLPPKEFAAGFDSAAFDNANKENSLVRYLGDVYVNLLRASRSHEIQYRNCAAESLVQLAKVLALKPTTPVVDAVEAACERVGWPEEPKDEFHRNLSRIAEAAITYLIEASGHTNRTLLSRRTAELVRTIADFQEFREERRKR